MQMNRWMCGVFIKDRTSEKLRMLVGVEPITTVIRSSRLTWYGHVMRKHDWVKNVRRSVECCCFPSSSCYFCFSRLLSKYTIRIHCVIQSVLVVA